MVLSTARRGRAATAPLPEGEPASPLTPAVFHIMVALAEGGAHGYAIMQDVRRVTGGEMKLGPGTLYRSIQRMLVDGLIQELDIALDGEQDDDRRRYYRLTPRGLAAARAEARRLSGLVDAARARKLLAPKTGGRR